MDDIVGRLAALAPEVDVLRIEEHTRRLDRRYFESFSEEEIATHLKALAGLGTEHPVLPLVRPIDERLVECTILAFDFPSEFSLIAGVLSSMGFDTVSGDVFTYSALDMDVSGRPSAWMHERPALDMDVGTRSELPAGGPRTGCSQAADRSSSVHGRPAASARKRRLIIDRFRGTVRPDKWNDGWMEELAVRLERVILILAQGGSDSLRRTKLAVNEMAAVALSKIGPPATSVLYPVSMEVDDTPPSCTRIRVVSQDTPFFLFAFATALSLQDVSIEHVTIRTEKGRIEDIFEFVDVSGKKIEDPGRIDRIKLSVLLTKQFTSFLEGAPDPLAALLRFETLVREVLPLPEQGRWMELLSNQHVMSDLAHILGASTYLWEDFIRLQYETLIPMLQPHVKGSKSLCEPLELLPDRLEHAVSGPEEEFERSINNFKDREIYLYDLDHILTPGSDFLTLSRRLTTLAELVVDAAAGHAYRALSRKFGEPRTVAGLPVQYAVMGLGKMGGAALGYASDIELLFVYSDNGSTSGPETRENTEFFSGLAREVQRLIHAKREGIFHIDLRLRPYGDAGPVACSLESFCTYYAKGGPALSYEKLSLVRLRAVGGDRSLGKRIERLRDDMIYAANSIDLGELRELRERQAREKTRAEKLNAKFSPGALVDLEYAVQVLQVIHGAEEKRLQTPRIKEALDILASIGVLKGPEARELASAYHFFRRLINGLRMLRGSAQDLFLPAVDSDEYGHLARRTGYQSDGEMSPAQKLHLDFETHTAEVRAFVERHFGRGSLPGTPTGNVADLILSDAVPLAVRDEILSAKGFRDPARAYINLRNIAGMGAGERNGASLERRSLFARLTILACDILSQKPDPDMALNNWERFLHSHHDPQAHLAQMLSQPMRLEILMSIFATSQFLADALVREPSFLDYISRSDVLHSSRTRGEIAGELAGLSARTEDSEEWLDSLRIFRRRETLRIGARDVCLGTQTKTVMGEISSLADGIIGAALARIREKRTRGREGASGSGAVRFCVIAFGKLGGEELNYSSDIDLLGLYDNPAGVDGEAEAADLMERLRSDLSRHMSEGYAYRVDLRLRPYGSSGQLVFSPKSLLRYYSGPAACWELQALLKARPVAGDLELGFEFLDAVKSLLTAERDPVAAVSSMEKLRKEAMHAQSHGGPATTDVKVGLGGIRDIEFLIQTLQLIHAHARPELICANTITAMEALHSAGILSGKSLDHLSADYIYLRRVEHFLQIYEDRQIHSLPKDPEQLRALSRRMLGSGATAEQFLSKLSKRFERVREEYETITAELRQ